MPVAPRTAAFFDFDGTLISGYSIIAFLKERTWHQRPGATDLLRSAVSAAQSAFGRIDSRELIARGIHQWSGRRVTELEELGERLFDRELRDRIHPEMRALVERHRGHGHLVAIATSATPFQVEPVARELGIEHVLCTRLESHDGILTGKSRGPVLWGRAKAAAVQDFARQKRIDLRRSYFYADGDEEIALMRAVGNPRPVNPRPALAAAAAREGWPVQRVSSHSARGADAYLRSALTTAGSVPVFAGALALRAITGDRREAANFLASTLSQLSLGLGKVKLDVSGGGHLWSVRPAVFIWNHRDSLDAQVVCRLVQRDFGAVIGKELERVPLYAAASRFVPIAFVDPADGDTVTAALEPSVALLREGVSVLVALGDMRATNSAVGPLGQLAFRMAMAAGVPVVPVVIRDEQVTVPRFPGANSSATIEVAVLPPVRVEDWTGRELDSRIEDVRQQFVHTQANWPRRTRRRAARRKTT